jgi:acyl-CoA reductase-like NAD-dependent aldehyde dehydrogenase
MWRMSRLTDQQVDQIAGRVLARMRGGAAGAGAARSGASSARSGTSSAGSGSPSAGSGTDSSSGGSRVIAAHSGMGVFPDVDLAVVAAGRAYQELSRLSLEKREEMIASIRESMRANAKLLADEAFGETGLGRAEDKLQKNLLVTNRTPGCEDLAPLAKSGDRGLMLTEPAPFGVIGAITPTTNPTSTIICNTIGMVAAGNAVVFNVHPNAKGVSQHNVALINEAIVKVGGPKYLVCTVGTPTIESAQQLMKHAGVRLLVVTGGPAVVKVAASSGKRAICAGPGNPPAVVDETADIDKAGRDIVAGASFDNNVICTDEKTTIVVQRVADELIKAMCRHGAMLLTPAQVKQVERTIITENRGPRKHAAFNKDMIGKDAVAILQAAGISADAGLRLAIMDVPNDHPLVWSEQMMPIMPVTRVRDADTAIDLAVEAELGRRHTASMHSKNLDNLSRMARVINCSIFIKNGPNYAGLGMGGEGWTSFSIASPTGEGMTRPRDFSRYRRCTLVDHFRIV